jgi:hypothetical protein
MPFFVIPTGESRPLRLGVEGSLPNLRVLSTIHVKKTGGRTAAPRFG